MPRFVDEAHSGGAKERSHPIAASKFTLPDVDDLLRHFVDFVSAQVALLDRDLRYIRVSRRFLTDFGLGDANLVGRSHYEVFPEITDDWKDVHRRALAGETIAREEDPFERADGTTQWLRWEVRPWFRIDGEVGGISIFSEDITERKRAEADREEKARQLRELADAVPHNVITNGANGGLVDCNRQMEEYSGIPRQEVIEWQWERLIHPDDVAATLNLSRTTIATGEPRNVEARFRRRDGVYRWHVVRQVPIRDGEGRTLRWYATATDVDDLKQSETRHNLDRSRYLKFLDELPKAVFLNTNGEITYCNTACARLFGVDDPSELIGLQTLELIHPDMRAMVRSRIAELLRTGVSAREERRRMLRRDGREFQAQVIAALINDEGRDAILVCVTDVTETDRATQLLQSVLESVDDSILMIKADGKIEMANSAVSNHFGAKHVELIGASVGGLIPALRINASDRYLQNYRETWQGKVRGVGCEVEARRKDGSAFPAELTITECRIDGQLHFTGVIRDVTERKQLEAKFLQSQKMEAVGVLAAGVAHDFNNILTVINGYCEMLSTAAPGPQLLSEALTAIAEAGGRATQLTRQLLTFSRQEIIQPQVVDANELVESMAGMLRRVIGENRRLSTNCHARQSRVLIDPGQFEQVLMNLVVNARDAMPDGGQLTLTTADERLVAERCLYGKDLPPGDYVRVSVADTGKGMSPDVLRHLFEPFFTTKPVGKGTGLGLSVVHAVVTQAGGAVDVECPPEGGTTFHLWLPQSAQEMERKNKDARESVSRDRSATILLVEDNEHVRRFACLALKQLGYEVLTAPDAAGALAMARDREVSIDLLMTDVVMPDLNGRELVDRIQQLRPGVPVLLMSGYTDDDEIIESVKHAEEVFLQKPFSKDDLAEKVHAALER